MNRIALSLAIALPLMAGGCMGSSRDAAGVATYGPVSQADADKAFRRSLKDAEERDKRARREAEGRCRQERGPQAPCNGLIAGNRR
jgi:hypothetical protein